MKTALVTGAAQGIGAATAGLFEKAGFRVHRLDKQPIAGGIRYDLRDLAGIPKLVASLGQIDVLVNNAGVLYCHPHDAFPDQDALEILTVNLRAPVALIEAVAPQIADPRDICRLCQHRPMLADQRLECCSITVQHGVLDA